MDTQNDSGYTTIELITTGTAITILGAALMLTLADGPAKSVTATTQSDVRNTAIILVDQLHEGTINYHQPVPGHASPGVTLTLTETPDGFCLQGTHDQQPDTPWKFSTTSPSVTQGEC